MYYTKNEFLDLPSVKKFIDWTVPLLSGRTSAGSEPFHSYMMGEKEKKFNSIYDAYFQYEWNREHVNPVKALSGFSKALRESLENESRGHDINRPCVEACEDILSWGGVLRGNKERIHRIATQENIVSYFINARDIFSGESKKSNKYYDGSFHMNAGFTKLYACCVDNFIIYDSRVAAALTMLVQRFAENWGFEEALEFKVPSSRGNSKRRRLQGVKAINTVSQYVENNVRANWLLSGILQQSENSEFNKIENFNDRLRALEAALFMIGYDVRSQPVG